MFRLSVYFRIPHACIRPLRRGILSAIISSIVILFFWSMAGLADIIITPEIVMKTIGKLSVTIFSTECVRNMAAKITASDIQEKVKTEHGEEIFLTFCNILNEILVSLITSIASSVQFSVQMFKRKACGENFIY